MAHRKLLLALTLIAATTPAWAAREAEPRPATAPPGTAETRYCMWMAATTGTLIEHVKCWTRDQWARQGVDVDKDWPRKACGSRGDGIDGRGDSARLARKMNGARHKAAL